MHGNEVSVQRILSACPLMGKPVRGRTAGYSPRLFRSERPRFTRVAWGRVAAVSSGPDPLASKSQAGSGRSPHGSNYSLYRCAMVARMSRASTIREAGDRRQTADTHNVECALPARERTDPDRTTLDLQKESLVVVESICVDSDEANVLEQSTSAFEELVPAETDGHLGQ